MDIKTLEIARHRTDLGYKAFTPEENLIQTEEGMGRNRKKRHNKWKTK